VAIELGVYFLSEESVRPGKLETKSFSRALDNVLVVGEKRAAWENFTRSAALVGMVTELMLSMMLRECGMVMVQRPFVSGDRVPERIVLF
jgi:hypothetical protein